MAAMPMPKRRSLVSQSGFDTPALAVVRGEFGGRLVGVGAGQAPGLLHARIAQANDAAHLIAFRGDRRTRQRPRASTGSDPGSGTAGLAGGGGHGDVAAEADDIV